MLKIFAYSLTLLNIFFLFYYLILNVEFIIFISLSLVFFFLYVMLKKFVLYKFFYILDSIYYLYYYLLYLNKLTVNSIKIYLNILNYLLVDVIKSIFLILINSLINTNLINIYLNFFKNNIQKFFIFFKKISLLLVNYSKFSNLKIRKFNLINNLDNFNNSYIYINILGFSLLNEKKNIKITSTIYVS